MMTTAGIAYLDTMRFASCPSGAPGRKYNGEERKAVPAVLAYRHYEANGGDPPAPFTGKYACFENSAYRELLNKYGQPCNANPAAKAAFLTRFRYRSWPSVSAHPNKFNLDEYKE